MSHRHNGTICSAQSPEYWKDVAEFELWRQRETRDLAESWFLLDLFTGLWEMCHTLADRRVRPERDAVGGPAGPETLRLTSSAAARDDTDLALRAFVMYRREIARALAPLVEQHRREHERWAPNGLPGAEREIYMKWENLERICALVDPKWDSKGKKRS